MANAVGHQTENMVMMTPVTQASLLAHLDSFKWLTFFSFSLSHHHDIEESRFSPAVKQFSVILQRKYPFQSKLHFMLPHNHSLVQALMGNPAAICFRITQHSVKTTFCVILLLW